MVYTDIYCVCTSPLNSKRLHRLHPLSVNLDKSVKTRHKSCVIFLVIFIFFSQGKAHNNPTRVMSRAGGTQPSHRERRQPQADGDGAGDGNSGIIGEHLEHELGEDFEANLFQTLSHEKQARTRRDHRNRIKRIITYWSKKCKLYYQAGVRKNTAEEMAAPLMWFFDGDFTEDIRYTNLNFKFVAKFLHDQKIVTTKKSSSQKTRCRSYDDMRKFRDAIRNGAKLRGEALPADFERQMDQYLAAYRKEYVKEKHKGNVESKDADPITFELYRLLLKWAAEDGNIFVFFWTLTQWNCMSRCASISPLGFRNMRVAMDAHSVQHHLTKADQEGERCFAKNIFANSDDWLLCHWTGMALYCALHDKSFEGAANDKFFWEPGTEEGSAAKKYQEQLHGMITGNQDRIDAVKQHCRLEHFNAYGLRKGPATHATAGTTMPPSMPSIAHRGDWSMGAVFDAYFKFLPTGDQYLGRILAGMDPNLASFKTLPPHWNIENPMSDPRIKDAMVGNFQTILENHGMDSHDPTGLLLRCLACLVWHSDAILETVPRKQLNLIPLFQPGSNLAELKTLVTTDPTPGVMTTATGIPPHVEVASQLKEIRAEIDTLILQVQENERIRKESEAEFKQQVLEVVRDGIEQQNLATGNITSDRLEQILQQHQEKQKDQIAKMFQDLAERHFGGFEGQEAPTNRTQQGTATNGSLLCNAANVFTYGGKMWDVPEDFEFPNKPTLDQALRLWLKGSSVAGGKVVRPYHKLVPNGLPEQPPALRQQLRGHWKQFFKFIDSVEIDGEKWNSDWPQDTVKMSNQQLQRTEKKMWEILQSRASYVWASKSKKDPKTFSLSTWAKKIAKSSIQKNGTEADQAFVQGRQPAKRQKANRKRQLKQAPLYPQRQINNTKRLRTDLAVAGLSAIQANLRTDRARDIVNGGRAPAAAFVRRDVEPNPTHVYWLIDNFGNNDRGRKPVPIVDGREAPRRGICACPGCTFVDGQLEGLGSHRCARCGIPVHNLCCQTNNTHFQPAGDYPKHFCTENCEAIWRDDNMMM